MFVRLIKKASKKNLIVKNDKKIYKTNLNLGYGLLHFVGVVYLKMLGKLGEG